MREKTKAIKALMFAMVLVVFSIMLYPNTKALEGFAYNATLLISNTLNSNNLTDYQVLITLNTQYLISLGRMRDDCGDIRFTDNDTITLLPYWIEDGCNTTNTKIWVKVPFIPASSTKIIYLYHGNPSATSASSVQNTFIANSIYAMSGNCTDSTNCYYMDNHNEADAIRGYAANICTKYVDKIYWGSVCDNSNPNSNVRDRFYSRFRFLFVPDVSGTWYFAVDSDDGSEIVKSNADMYGGIIHEHMVIASWYAGHGWCNCQSHNGSISLVAGQGIWLDYIQEEWDGGEAAVVWVLRPGGSWVNLNTTNFPNQIFARKYTSPEPTITSIINCNTTENSIYNKIATENTTETFALEVNNLDIENITAANLTYNGINYTANITKISDGFWNLTAAINVGSITDNLKQNKTFNWTYAGILTNGFSFSQTTQNYNQTVYVLYRRNLTYKNDTVLEYTIQQFNLTERYSVLASSGYANWMIYPNGTDNIENITINHSMVEYPVIEINTTYYLRIPAISASYNQTNSFNISTRLDLLNGTSIWYNSTHNQTVYKLVIATSGLPAPNTTIYTHNYKNEETDAAVTGNFNTLVYAFVPQNFGRTEFYRNYTITTTGATSQTLYLYPAWANVSLIIQMQNTATGFNDREHYLCRNFGNTSYSVTQYLLNSSNPNWVKFYFTLLDVNQQPLENYYVTIEKYKNFNYIYLGARKTDKFGQFVERLELDKQYRLRAYNPNCTLEKEWILTITCKEAPCTYDLVVSETGKPFEPLKDIQGFSYSWEWDSDNKNITFAYKYSGNESFEYVKFYVLQKSPENETKFCTETEYVNTERSFSCNLANYTKGSFIAYAEIKIGSKTQILYYNIDLFKKEFGKEGLVWALLIIITLFFVGIWNPVVAIGGSIFGIIIVALLGFVTLPYIFIILVVTLAIIIITKIKS